MPNNYRYLNSRGKSLIFANTANTKDLLVTTLDVLNPKALTVPVHRVQLVRNTSFALPQEIEGCDPCNIQKVDLSVALTFSGPVASKTEQLRLLDELVLLVKEGAFDAQFNGFPLRVTDTFVTNNQG